MAGIVYLRTNRFEVKLEGITFKKKNFESLCKMDFLFPDGKEWDRPPIVGLDVMPHPRDPSIILLLLCFGIGSVILRFSAGEALPAPIHRFLADKRIRVVAFGVPEKIDLFPFEELGLTKDVVDIGYIAAKVFNDRKYKRYELGQLARKVLGIKEMVGLTEEASFERHAQIKCAICQLFVTSVIAMGLSNASEKKKLDYPSKKKSFLKNLNSLHLLAEGWFKLPRSKSKKKKQSEDEQQIDQARKMDSMMIDVRAVESPLVNYLMESEIGKRGSGDYSSIANKLTDDDAFGNYDDVEDGYDKEKGNSSDDSGKNDVKKPIKGILKCPSTKLFRCDSSSPIPATPPSPSTPKPATPPSPSTPNAQMDGRSMLKRANSKGCNVRFNFLH